MKVKRSMQGAATSIGQVEPSSPHRLAVTACGGGAALCALTVLCFHVSGMSVMAGFYPGLPPMTTIYATAVLLVSFALLLSAWAPTLPGALGGLRLAAVYSGMGLGTWLVIERSFTSHAGETQLGIATSMSLLAISVGLALPERLRRSRELLAMFSFLLSYMNLVGYIDGYGSHVGFEGVGMRAQVLASSTRQGALILGILVAMTLPSALSCTLLSVGVLLLRPGEEFALLLSSPRAGLRTRRLLLAALLLPPLAGWLRFLGLKAGFFDLHFGTEVFTLANVIGFVLLLFYDARSLERSERARARADAAVAQRTAELEQANQDLLQLDKMKSEFLATVTHELLTPMNAVLGFTEILLAEPSARMGEEHRKYLTIVHESGQHLLGLIQKLLYVQRIEAGAVTVQANWFDVTDMLSRVVADVTAREQMRSSDVSLEICRPVEPVQLYSDEEKLGRVVADLVQNAIRFTPEGKIQLVCEAHDSGVEIQVIDSGVGIAREDLQRIFEPFQQSDTPLSRYPEGVGIGLFMCKRVVDMLHGTIDVRSVPNEGSTFVVTLPRQLRAG